MNSYEIVSLSMYKLASSYMLEIRWKVSTDDCEPTWHARRYHDLQPPDRALRELLEALSEEVYNLADWVEAPADQLPEPPSPSGGIYNVPLF